MEAGLVLAFALSVIGKLGEIATQHTLDEASLLLNFRNDFLWLESKLRQICASLQAADKQSEQNYRVKEWLAEVGNVAFDAEDIIDECTVERLYTNTCQSCVSNSSQWVFRYKMGKRIKDIKDRIRASIQGAQVLTLFHIDVSHLSQPSTSTFESEKVINPRRDVPAVAFDEKVDELMALLENPAIGIVAVVGMGGLGKTFLLQHVFNRSKYRYECSAWICVSNTYSLRSLQHELAAQINLQIEGGISNELAAELIHEQLKGKRCLIVLDDVWTSVLEDNSLISGLGLPAVRNSQCKIVVTSRIGDVARSMNARIYEMQVLSEEDSWNLFSMFAFPSREGNRPPEHLKAVAHQIVERCGRLPLAVKTVAASMARSVDIADWHSKLRILKDVTAGEEESITAILRLTCRSLPPYLKACFAYFSFFPEDTQISLSFSRPKNADIFVDMEYVIYLWIAEGFVPQEVEIEQFDIGLNYLHQLQNLCLLEVDTLAACYTIHDLLLDLAIHQSKEHESEFNFPSDKTSCRRLLLPKMGITTDAISNSSLHRQRFLRTISFSHNPKITGIPEHLFDRLRVLRILDFSCTAISTLPRSVGRLRLLKVLNLSQTNIREVPYCIRRLKCLVYLDISGCSSIQRLPDWIGDLKSLSVLKFYDCSEELANRYMPKGLSNLPRLRTLRSEAFPLSTRENPFLNVEDVGKMTNLRDISFCLKDEDDLRSVEDGIFEPLAKMRNLCVVNGIPARESDREESYLSAFPDKMNVMKDLQQLALSRFTLPSWICGLVNLTELALDRCSDYPLLQNLSNLQALYLSNDSRCRVLPKEFGECGGFPKLVRLWIGAFPLLEDLPALEEGAMQRLEGLMIFNCPRVKKLPDGFECLRRLKMIDLDWGSADLWERLEESGLDLYKLKNKRVCFHKYVYETNKLSKILRPDFRSVSVDARSKPLNGLIDIRTY